MNNNIRFLARALASVVYIFCLFYTFWDLSKPAPAPCDHTEAANQGIMFASGACEDVYKYAVSTDTFAATILLDNLNWYEYPSSAVRGFFLSTRDSTNVDHLMEIYETYRRREKQIDSLSYD